MQREIFRSFARVFNEGRSKWALLTHSRFFAASIRPTESVYGGQKSSRPITHRVIRQKFLKGEPLSMVTAYDYPSAVHVENSEIDFLLVGDSAAMVVHGYETTLPITLDEMILHCQAVVRGASRPFIVGDLPFGSYEASQQQAVASGMRLMKEGSVDAIKLEGGTASRVQTAKSLTQAGIAVMGHVGLTPQMISILGGFRPQAQMAERALETIQQGKELQEAGCFAMVLECVPAAVGAALQSALDIPVIGIGAGPACAGQVRPQPYLSRFSIDEHPHHAKVMPKFCKRYSEVGEMINKALVEFNREVKDHTFPGKQYSPYPIELKELEKLCSLLEKDGMKESAEAAYSEYQIHENTTES